MQLNPSLAFNGNAEEALELYRDALGGDLEIHRFAGSPAAEHAPAEWQSKVLYGALRTSAGVIAGMDASPACHELHIGNNFSIAIQAESDADATSIFSKLSEGGSVTMPLEKTFFAEKFGMLEDRFGVRWMISYAVAPVASPA
jgi:PhnB protein